MSFDIPYQMRQMASSLPFPNYKRCFTNFWHSGDKSDFLPMLQKSTRLFCSSKIYSLKDIWIFRYSNPKIITLVPIMPQYDLIPDIASAAK